MVAMYAGVASCNANKMQKPPKRLTISMKAPIRNYYKNLSHWSSPPLQKFMKLKCYPTLK